ncbi:MAG: sulfatase-like hydrolase/transferase [Verrucomicrobia bacterium]|nr:sulfatase-like hydrolase/transferase [Verrucomicrobiota bacterium]
MKNLLQAILLLSSITIGFAASRPNILLLVADDLGYGELSCQGNPEIPTPHIDSLARNGVRFTAGYVTAPLCSPSRAGLITGRFQSRFGHELNAIGKQNLDPEIGLPLTERTLADHLKAAGYATGIVGKWHLGATEKFQPLRRGFDEFFGFLHEGHYYVPPPYRGVYSRFRTNENPYDADNSLIAGTREIVETNYLTDAFTREAVGFIERHRAQPWFLYVPYNAVHSPMQAKLADVEKFSAITNAHRAVFAAMLHSLDESVGAILAKLRALGLEDDTLIFFLSDNGGPTAELTSSNLPLNGGKGSLLEGGIRIPFLAQWKGRIPAGKVFTPPVSSLDLVPTALAAAGVDGGGKNLEGSDLVPFLSGAKAGVPHEALFWRIGEQRAARAGQWKFVQRGKSAAKLYDLDADISETHDLAAERPEVLARLQTAYANWDRQNVPPRWGASAPKRN